MHTTLLLNLTHANSARVKLRMNERRNLNLLNMCSCVSMCKTKGYDRWTSEKKITKHVTKIIINVMLYKVLYSLFGYAVKINVSITYGYYIFSK